jgi:hypothetical protein
MRMKNPPHPGRHVIEDCLEPDLAQALKKAGRIKVKPVPLRAGA